MIKGLLPSVLQRREFFRWLIGDDELWYAGPSMPATS